jgi:hypothetical protein
MGVQPYQPLNFLHIACGLGKFFVSLALTKYTSNPAFFENVVDRLDI